MSKNTEYSTKSKIYASLHQDEIANLVSETFEEAGGPFHFQSKTISLVAKEAVGSNKHNLCTVQPRISPIDSDIWKDGFSLVLAFLKHYNMENTIEAIKTEIGDELPEQKHVYDPEQVDKYFSQLVELQDNFKERDFDQNVKNFIEDIKYDEALQFSVLANSAPLSKKPPTKKQPVQKEEDIIDDLE